MKLKKAIETLNKSGYPTKETVEAFGVKYPALFRLVARKLGYKEV